jgi:serine phosphatase RsbU (regulator of sigma subunit)
MSAPAVPGARILVVDDNAMNRDMLARRLTRHGYTVDMAENGRQALERARSEKYDLMLLDVMMPELDGRQVLAEWVQDQVLRHIPVVMISASDETETVVKCIELGADDYLPKPFNPVILQARVGASLEKKRLRDRERLHAESLERELAIGREIQATFLPESIPQPDGWEIAARFEPARQCAGDFYDTFLLTGDRIGLAIADVCDKGVGAALFMALFRSLIRSTAEQAARDSESDEIVRRAVVGTNDYIARTHGRTNMFATLFFGIAETATGEIRYINAGHEAPLMLAASGAVVATLAPTGPAVGLLPDSPFTVGKIDMARGETLFAYTDGVTDARGNDEFFGRDRLLALTATPRSTAGGLLDVVASAVHGHVGNAERYDDVTMLAVRRLG